MLRINSLEKLIGPVEKVDAAEDRSGKEPTPAAKPGKLDRAAAYALARKEFNDGRYSEAQRDLRNFLGAYPSGEYSDNAQFWLGECYYVAKEWEQAILEYEKVMKNFPNSEKVPYALLKQGMSFLNLGDRKSAKLILKRVSSDYSNTNQARLARAKLSEIK